MIDVVRRVEEVRDPRPRHAGQVVEVHGVAVVVVQQRCIHLRQDFGRDRLVILSQAMRAQLEIREHHLREEGAGDVVDRVLQQNDPFGRVVGLLQHVVEQQRLAQRGRHFRDEDRVVRVHKRLPLVREHRVHRVAHLMRQREHVVQRVIPVEEHVRMNAVHRR